MVYVISPVETDVVEAARNTVQWDAHSFGMSVQAALGPKILDGRGLQGRVLLVFAVNGDGALAGAHISKSSGHDALDREALRIVGKAVFPAPPAHLSATHRTFVSAFTFT